jgi:hypothetical protein
MKKYILKIALHGVSPMIWRRLTVPGTTSLATLHKVIQIANAWDNDHLHRFHIYAVDYGISYIGGMSFRDDAHKVYLNDFNFDAGDKFFYEYNFNESHIVDIRVESITEEEVASRIRCIKGNGIPGVERYDEAEASLDLLKAIAKSDCKTTVGDILPLIEAWKTTRFNKGQINHRLDADLGN